MYVITYPYKELALINVNKMGSLFRMPAQVLSFLVLGAGN